MNEAGRVSNVQHRTLLTRDGIRIAAEFHPPATGGEATSVGLVIAHGFSGSTRKPANRHIIEHLSIALPVVAFDFRGHGRSAGESTLGDAEINEVTAAVSWGRTLGWRRVVTLGFSMGAAIVVRHAGLVGDVDGVVAVSGPAFWRYMGTPVMRRLAFGVEHPVGRVIVRHGMHTRVAPPPWPEPWPKHPVETAAAIPPVPFLVVHGRTDPFFPDEHPRAVVEAANRGAAERGLDDYRADLWMADFGHAENAIPDAMLDRIGAWVRDVALTPTGRPGSHG